MSSKFLFKGILVLILLCTCCIFSVYMYLNITAVCFDNNKCKDKLNRCVEIPEYYMRGNNGNCVLLCDNPNMCIFDGKCIPLPANYDKDTETNKCLPIVKGKHSQSKVT